jgi:hypothetical protein
VIGAMTPPAWRRAVRRANGWYGFALDVAATERSLAGLAQAAQEVERPAALGPLEISVTPPPGLPDRDALRRYAELGVARLVLLPNARSGDEIAAFVDRAAAACAGI